MSVEPGTWGRGIATKFCNGPRFGAARGTHSICGRKTEDVQRRV